jgi:hypothetical protein
VGRRAVLDAMLSQRFQRKDVCTWEVGRYLRYFIFDTEILNDDNSLRNMYMF